MSEIHQLNLNDKPSATKLVGERGEDLAAEYLIRRGYRIICSNFKTPIGRNTRNAAVTGEIDIIAFDKDVLCFIEVKTRTSDDFASPLAAVDLRKQRQIIRTAKVYRKIFNLTDIKFRYDAVSIVLKKNELPEIEHFKNFWTEAKFKKKFWQNEMW
jgi:putative endonuclease